MSATLRPEPDVPAPRPAASPPAAPETGRYARALEIFWLVALACLLAGTAALMFYLARGLTFTLDEWIWVADRRGPGAPSLLEPHNEHLSILPLSAFLALLKIGGLDAQPLMMVPLVALQLALGVLLFVFARPRIGSGAAVGVAGLALVAGLAYENFLIPGQMGQMASIVAGVGAFVVLDRPRSRRTDVALAILVGVALTSSGLGVPVLAGVAVELALTAEGRRRLWVVAVPFAVYLVWYLGYGTNRAVLENLSLTSLWAWLAANHGAGAIIGERQIEPGRNLLIFILVVLAWRFWRGSAAARPRLAALTALLVSFYALTAISRYDVAPPSSSRYLTVGLVFLLLALVEAARDTRIRWWAPIPVLALVLIAFSNDHRLVFKEGRATLLERTQRVRASLGAVELLGRDRVDPDLEIAPRAAPLLYAGRWFAARDGLRGDPAYSAADLPRASNDARTFADDTLLRAGAVAQRRAAPGACRPAWRGRSGRLPAGGVRVQATGSGQVILRARRFGTEASAAGLDRVPSGGALELRPRPDAAPAPYVLETSGAGRVCRL